MHTTTAGTNFEAVDRVVKIVRELDRYHGFAAVPRNREELEPRRLSPSVEPLALKAPGRSDFWEFRRKTLKRLNNGLGNCDS